MKRYFVFAILIALFIAGCGPSPDEIAQQTAAAETQIAEVWTPTPTSTSTPLPTLTATPTLTPLPTVTPRMPTPDLSLTSPPVEQLSFPFIVINKVDNYPVPYTLQLYDLSSGGVRYIEFDDFSTPRAIGWVDHGCQILVAGSRQTDDDSWVYEIIRSDLQGNEQVTIITSDRPGVLSPTFDYLAYIGGSGECMGMVSRCEIQRAYVITSPRLDNPVLLELSSNDSVMELVWSPTGDRLVFSDIDENGQRGLYVIKPDNTDKIHLINLDQPIADDQQGLQDSPLWSPQGDAIAVADWIEQSPDEYKYVIRILSPTGGELHQVPVDVPPRLVSWSEDGREIVFRVDREKFDGPQPHIFWLDIASGEVVHTLRDNEVEEDYYIVGVDSINYAEDLLLTMDYTTSAYLYNRTSQNLIPISSRPIFDGLPSSIVVPPPDFPGEENCPTTP